MVAVLLWVTAAGVYLGSVVVARHRAQAAADLAALAAAARLPSGARAACARATAVTRRMRVDDTRCEVDGLDVVITVGVAVVFAGAARAVARAGPVETGQPIENAVAPGLRRIVCRRGSAVVVFLACVHVGTRSAQDQCAPFCAVQAWPQLGAQRLSVAAGRLLPVVS